MNEEIGTIVKGLRDFCKYHKIWIDGRDGMFVELKNHRVEILRADDERVIGNVITRGASDGFAFEAD